MERMILAVLLVAFGSVAVAGTPGWVPVANPVPVDSPFALLGLAAAITLVVARVLRNRRNK